MHMYALHSKSDIFYMQLKTNQTWYAFIHILALTVLRSHKNSDSFKFFGTDIQTHYLAESWYFHPKWRHLFWTSCKHKQDCKIEVVDILCLYCTVFHADVINMFVRLRLMFVQLSELYSFGHVWISRKTRGNLSVYSVWL